jgi:hypothetical protein
VTHIGIAATARAISCGALRYIAASEPRPVCQPRGKSGPVRARGSAVVGIYRTTQPYNAVQERSRSPHGDEFDARGQQRSRNIEDSRVTDGAEVRKINHARTPVGARGGAAMGATRCDQRTPVGSVGNGADAGRRRQANRQRSEPADGHEPSGHRGPSRVRDLSCSEQLRGVEPASRADAENGNCRNEARQPRRSPARYPDVVGRGAP